MACENDFILAEFIKPTSKTKANSIGEHIVSYSKKKLRVVQPSKSWLNLIGFRDVTTINYKVVDKGYPFSFKGIDFSWKELAAGLELSFDAAFEIRVSNFQQAQNIINAVNFEKGVYFSLHNVIAKSLHQHMSHLSAGLAGKDLFEVFDAKGIARGESVELNTLVSESVRGELGVEVFKIGFSLKNRPPMQVEVDFASGFNVPESEKRRMVVSRALLNFVNYQRYKRSGLDSVEQIQNEVRNSIESALKEYLYNKSLFDIAENFDRSGSSSDVATISEKIKEKVEKDVKDIGYSLNMLQTFPELPILGLVEGMRIEYVAKDGDLITKNSTGNVKLSVAMDVCVVDFKRLKGIITSDVIDGNIAIECPVIEKVRQICVDEIKKFERESFNLHFETEVEPRLKAVITEHLENRYGLRATGLYIHALQTEDGERFNAILKKSVDTDIIIEPVAHGGLADTLNFLLTFEVVGMDSDGWWKFESKDYGYKKSSSFASVDTIQKIREISHAEPGEELFEIARKNWSVSLELKDISKRIKDLLEDKLSKVPDITSHTKSIESDKEIWDFVDNLVKKHISKEFGLEVSLLSFKRQLTEHERIAKENLLSESKVKSQIVQNRAELVSLRNDGDKQRLQSLLHSLNELSVKESFEDDDDEFDGILSDTQEMREKIESEIEKIVGKRKSDPYDIENTTDLISVKPELNNSDKKSLSESLDLIGKD